MADHKRELRSRYDSLRRLYDDLSGTAFARLNWDSQVLARRTLGSEERIEHGFLAEHFLVTWSNWRGLFDRFCRYFGQPTESFPKTWAQLVANCDTLVFGLVRERELDEIIANSWADPDPLAFKPNSRRAYDISSIYSQIARGYERAELLSRGGEIRPGLARKKVLIEQMIPDREVLPGTKRAVDQANDALLERWHGLPRKVQDQVWVHLRHYLHSILGVSWLVDAKPSLSALLSISWRNQPVTLSLKSPVGVLSLDSPTPETIDQLLDRLKTAIGELGYEAVVEDLLSPDLLGGEDSLLPSQEIMVVPGHLADTCRPILLAVTKGWNGKEPLSFAKVMRQVKARLIEANGTIKVVIVFCDCWDSASFQEDHREELRAHAGNGIRFVFVLVGVPDRVLVPVPVEFDQSPR